LYDYHHQAKRGQGRHSQPDAGILNKDAEEAWLDRTNDDTEYLKSLLQPYDAEQMEAYEVSTAVGSPRNNTKDLVEPL
jgi:putative SOS response-associated peptidase YedK